VSAANFKLVVVDDVVQMQQCSLYHTHEHPLIEYHHVCPDSWWPTGQSGNSPLARLCPDCHYGVHVAIDAIIKGQQVTLLHHRWVWMAQQAFIIAKENGLTPKLTL
jgi:hypothetical protein